MHIYKVEKFSTKVVPHLKAAFQVGQEEHNSFSYIAMEIHSLKDEIWVQGYKDTRKFICINLFAFVFV